MHIVLLPAMSVCSLFVLLALGVAATKATASSNATLTMLTSPVAKCLDGSQGGFYYRPGQGEDINKWLFTLEGGGLCSHENDCKERAKTALGSSTYFPESFDFDTISITSSDQANPFREYNFVYMPYCDGGMWSGTRTEATEETWGLYMSGHNIIEATLTTLSETNGLNTTGNVVVFSGGSAGGVGVFVNYEYVRARLKKEVVVVGAPVGGFPPEIFWYNLSKGGPPEEDVRNSNFKYLYDTYDSFVPSRCRAAYGEQDAWKCFIPYLAYPHYVTPMFIIESQTDVVIMGGFEGMDHKLPGALLNPDVWHWINEYGANATENFKQINITRDGLYAPVCLMHTGFLLKKPIINGVGVADALMGWLKQYLPGEARQGVAGAHMYEDHCKNGKYYPPCNPACPPL